MKTTIRDVANYCGCSPTTVSLVLNRRPCHISPELRDLVFSAARQLNYRPNQLAVSLIKQQTGVIGLIVPDSRSPFFSSICTRVESVCRQSGYTLIYGNTDEKQDLDIAYLNAFLDRNVEGLIIIRAARTTKENNEACLRVLESANTPIVLADRGIPGYDGKLVSFDYQALAEAVARHLLELGHRMIACVTGPRDYTSTIQRVNGYRNALLEYNIPFRPELVFEASYSDSNVACSLLPDLLGAGATAVIACNSIIALGIYQGSNLYRKRVPQDVSIASTEDNPLFLALHTPLTAMSTQDSQTEVGNLAARELIERIHGHEVDNQPALLCPNLNARESTAPLVR